LRRSRSDTRYQRPFKTILYISMEYCEKRTLRDLIRKGLYKDNEEIWRLFRQVLEGLVSYSGKRSSLGLFWISPHACLRSWIFQTEWATTNLSIF
jgi:serine/threonine protein kinase